MQDIRICIIEITSDWLSIKAQFLYARIQTGRILVWWCRSVHPGLRPSVTVFRLFLPHTLTYWTEILYGIFFLWTFDQVRVSSISVNFCWSYAPFWDSESWKYTVFCTVLLYALTYWASILRMTLLYCTTYQVRVLSICFNIWRSYALFRTSNAGNTQFSLLFSYMLWHMELKFCIWLCYTVLQIKSECRQFASILVGLMPLLEAKSRKYQRVFEVKSRVKTWQVRGIWSL